MNKSDGNLMRADEILWDLMKSIEVWLNLMRCDEIWWELMRANELDEIWWDLTGSGGIWWALMRSAELWWDLMRSDGIRWVLVKSWWERMRPDKIYPTTHERYYPPRSAQHHQQYQGVIPECNRYWMSGQGSLLLTAGTRFAKIWWVLIRSDEIW